MSFIMNQNDKNKVEKFGMTQNELNELRYHYVDRYVESQPDLEFLDEAREYWEEHFDDVVKDIKEYANSKFKKPIEDRNVN